MKCPTCGSHDFYIKDKDDEFETHEFHCSEGCVTFSSDENEPPEITDDSNICCDQCTWRGKFCDLD